MTFRVNHDGKSWLVHAECIEGQLTRFISEEIALEQEEVEQEESETDA